jgi:hypothetical protein
VPPDDRPELDPRPARGRRPVGVAAEPRRRDLRVGLPAQSDVAREAQVDVGSGVATANAPALQCGLEDHHRHVGRVDGDLAEPLDEGPIEVPLRVGESDGGRQ